jgi:hypothetical protein
MGDLKIIPALTPEALLKRRVRDHLHRLGFSRSSSGALLSPDAGKESVRALHRAQRRDKLIAQKDFIKANSAALLPYFAAGSDIDISMIRPRLELVEADSWQSNLFRLASLSWSVPVSQGFGRRLRYLVWDDSNKKLMGLIALGDPVFNLRARDELIGWSSKDREKRLVNIMDAYVLGALPPYNMLLGGKVVSSLLRTTDIRADFAAKYSETRGIISKKKKKAQLVLITTSSSLGRSSVYNRVRLGQVNYLESIGYTGGWGHFHVPDGLFASLRDYLRDFDHGYVDAHKFGEGPNWRLRTIRAAFDALGFGPDLLRHGIKREVFVCKLASNAERVLMGEVGRAYCRDLKSVAEVGELARLRWIVGRAERNPEYKSWTTDQFLLFLSPKHVAIPPAEIEKLKNAGRS